MGLQGGLIQSTLVGRAGGATHTHTHTHHSSPQPALKQFKKIFSELFLVTGGPFAASEVQLCAERLLSLKEFV